MMSAEWKQLQPSCREFTQRILNLRILNPLSRRTSPAEAAPPHQLLATLQTPPVGGLANVRGRTSTRGFSFVFRDVGHSTQVH